MTRHYFDISFPINGPLDFRRTDTCIGLRIQVDEGVSQSWTPVDLWSRRDYLMSWLSGAETLCSGNSDRVQFVTHCRRTPQPDEERLTTGLPVDCWAWCAWLESDGLVHVRDLAFCTAVLWFPWDRRNIPHARLPDREAHPWGGKEHWTTTLDAVIEFEARHRARLKALGVL